MAGKKIFSWVETTIIIILVVGCYAGVYYYNTPVKNATDDVIKYYAQQFGLNKPCVDPIVYKIGAIDPRFNITSTQLRQHIAKASAVWSNEIGHPLFKEGTDADLIIDLVFDNRQATTLDLKEIGSVIDQKRVEYNALKSNYKDINDSFVEQKKLLDIKVAEFKKASALYESQVTYWNRHGGASQKEAGRLDAERADLNAMIKDINAQQSALNALVDKINAMTSTINALAKELNINVAEYNTRGASTGKEFNEGEYIQDATGQRIIIYQFDTATKLIRVLEHELGHALGMQHVTNPTSIMYYLNEGSNEKLTAEDVAELKSICRLTL